MKLRTLSYFLCCFFGLCSSLLAEPDVSSKIKIIYPKPLTDFDKRSEYPIELLKLALSKVDSNYELIPSPSPIKQKRALFNLKNHNNMDIVWSMTSTEREQQLRPIRIPIYKGLIGWRVGLIRQNQLDWFIEPSNQSKFNKILMLQGHDWPDTAILKANGFQVTTSSNYASLFKMLANKRGNYFPRSIVEIWAEATSYAEQNIIVEPNFLIKYPTAFYYFVHPSNVEFADKLEQALEMSVADGSFDKLFFEYHHESIAKANLASRHIIELNNPILPKLTPIHRKELWFSLPDTP